MKIYIPSLDNKHILDDYLQYNTFRGCELAPANPVLWSGLYHTGFTLIEDKLCFCQLRDGDPVTFSFPIGEGDKRKAFEAICSYYESHNMEFTMYAVGEEIFSVIDNWYPGVYKIAYDRDSADYLYETKTLANLTGKKLHGKRNHINRFLENYPDYEYEHINDSNWKDCLQIAYDWIHDNQMDSSRDEDRDYEYCALKFALEHRVELGLSGALIRVDGKAIAFTLGEPLTEDTFDIHFEKAYADIQGAYAMINREFVRRELMEYQYVNREEDMGIPGLRHAKTSYQPVRLIEKGFVTRK